MVHFIFHQPYRNDTQLNATCNEVYRERRKTSTIVEQNEKRETKRKIEEKKKGKKPTKHSSKRMARVADI